jgi:hypothetical protein
VEGRQKVSVESQKRDVVVGLTGVHITYEPDRVQVLRSIPELGLQPGDIISRYMYHGEGFANIRLKSQWKQEYDLSFITETDRSGCSHGCAAKVISYGKKDWWVRFKTARDSIGWAKARHSPSGEFFTTELYSARLPTSNRIFALTGRVFGGYLRNGGASSGGASSALRCLPTSSRDSSA